MLELDDERRSDRRSVLRGIERPRARQGLDPRPRQSSLPRRPSAPSPRGRTSRARPRCEPRTRGTPHSSSDAARYLDHPAGTGPGLVGPGREAAVPGIRAAAVDRRGPGRRHRRGGAPLLDVDLAPGPPCGVHPRPAGQASRGRARGSRTRGRGLGRGRSLRGTVRLRARPGAQCAGRPGPGPRHYSARQAEQGLDDLTDYDAAADMAAFLTIPGATGAPA